MSIVQDSWHWPAGLDQSLDVDAREAWKSFGVNCPRPLDYILPKKASFARPAAGITCHCRGVASPNKLLPACLESFSEQIRADYCIISSQSIKPVYACFIVSIPSWRVAGQRMASSRTRRSVIAISHFCLRHVSTAKPKPLTQLFLVYAAVHSRAGAAGWQ